MFVPKSIVCLREGISREQLLRDLLAGVVVGVVALPLALAFAIASGVPPERGLYTAIVAGFLISALGGSRVQIGGPTGAFVVIVFGIVSKLGYEGLVICTVIAGFILILFGLARMGTLIKFIPYPVTTGFTAGIAVIIFSGQVKDLLGLRMGKVPADLMDKWVAYWDARATVNIDAVLVAGFALLVLIVWPKIFRLIPAPFVAMVLATALVQIFHLPVETIGSRFGAMPSHFPVPHWPSIPWNHMRDYISPALTVALLAAIESLLSAVVADGMIGTRHKSGHRQCRLANLRRHSSDGRDRPHGDEHPHRRADANRRHHARRHASAGPPSPRSLGFDGSADCARGDPGRRVVPHERMAVVRQPAARASQ